MNKQVKEFMTAFGQYPCNEGLVTLLPLRFKLIDEEVEELKNAKTRLEIIDAVVDIIYVGLGTLICFEADIDVEFDNKDPWDDTKVADIISKVNTNSLACARTREEFLDATEEILYRVEGIGAMFDLEGAFNEVHRSNMSKLDRNGNPIKNHYGKVLKGPEYSPPNLGPYLPKEQID